MILFNDTLSAYGGTHTLMLRMCEWLAEKKIKNGVICQSCYNTEIVEALKKNGTEIFEVDVRNEKKILKILQSINEEIMIINFGFDLYLDIEIIKQRNKMSFINIVYCVHVDTFRKGSAHKALMRLLAEKIYKPLFRELYRCGHLIMMDDICLKKTEEYMECSLDNVEIAYIPMNFENENKNEIIKEGYDGKQILTAARAEFPYKGYLLGLVRDCASFMDINNSITLKIISDGDHIEELEREISRIPECYKNRIILEHWIPYEKLQEEMKKSYLFIGMGTGVLDAARVYKIGIPVKMNTYDLVADCFFYEKPNYICAMSMCKERAASLIIRALNFDFETYKDKSILSYNNAKELYDIDKIMNQIITYQPKENNLNKVSLLLWLHKMKRKINKIQQAVNKDYFQDYRKLSM